MENWGLITYRTTAVLYNEATSDSRYKNRVAYVVAHGRFIAAAKIFKKADVVQSLLTNGSVISLQWIGMFLVVLLYNHQLIDKVVRTMAQ